MSPPNVRCPTVDSNCVAIVKSGLGLLAKPLGSIVAGRNFEVDAADFPAVILILDTQVRYGDFAVHDLEVKLVRDEDSFVLE